MRQRSFSVNYELVSLAIGLGDEAIYFPKDDRIIFFMITEFMSMAYILGLCHLSGYISAFYSIKTGFRVATTSWLQVTCTLFHPKNGGDAPVFSLYSVDGPVSFITISEFFLQGVARRL